jgi:N-methylhydantoinase A/oxoprolinase/acetone carboxylase beta subunit
MRGACALAEVSDALVIDVGGTSTDVGILVDGFPRESSKAVEVGGVRTNFRMPDLISTGLGGGTIVRDGRDGFRIGPDSVGYDVVTKAIAVGGDTTTLTDISLKAGRMRGFGQLDRLDVVSDDVVDRTIAWVDSQITTLCERLKTSSTPVPLLAVGGGAHLVPDVIDGISKVIRPRHHALANAFGAAIAEASGSVDRVYSYDAAGRDACLDDAKELATQAAIRAGAHPDQVRITTVSEIPMTYVPGGGCRVVVKAAGPLAS